ncbi:hypothetical protein PXK01_19640 [Phaeobacter sp. PT47_59]|uniref:hypothetical protein n=1 Tax=Phaeobacter sp. PT47_59 TaxID=3029979 RepID=UPI0023809CE8|nr:hypothetical protein [Phaeobacter sp. PT47_59]MDE4176375.1 hypothetical protein [Phaeobacter sp. PT47_59]
MEGEQRKETPRERAKRLMIEVSGSSKETYSKGDVKTMLNSIAGASDGPGRAAGPISDEGCRAPACLDELRRGDVFIAKAVGGKVRPWIVLRVTDDVVTAVSMSSGDSAPNMVRSECRYWPGGWIGSTLAQFPIEKALAEVTRPYTNLPHLRAVEREAYRRMGAVLIGPSSISEIRFAMGGAA